MGVDPRNLGRDDFPERDARFYRPAIVMALIAGIGSSVFAWLADFGVGYIVLTGLASAVVGGLWEARLLTLGDRLTRRRPR